jgi:hypothetical protein
VGKKGYDMDEELGIKEKDDVLFDVFYESEK